MAQREPTIVVKRVYDAAARGDGPRILVDRLWPRGLRKEDVHADAWSKDLAPSTELRRFYGHQPELFGEFSSRYRAELRRPERATAIDEVLERVRRGPVTLLTATRDLEHSGAAVLAGFLRDEVGRGSRSASPASSRQPSARGARNGLGRARHGH